MFYALCPKLSLAIVALIGRIEVTMMLAILASGGRERAEGAEAGLDMAELVGFAGCWGSGAHRERIGEGRSSCQEENSSGIGLCFLLTSGVGRAKVSASGQNNQRKGG